VALVGLVLAAAWSIAAAAGVPKTHGPNLWAGDWRTTSGLVGFRLLRPSEVVDAQRTHGHSQLYDKLPCKRDGPQFYEGGYESASDSGRVLACGTPTEIEGRWLSDNNASNAGSFTLKIASQSPLTFTGTAVPDVGKSFRWSGAFAKDFGGDGANVAFFVDFSVIVKGKPNFPIKGAPNMLTSARLSGQGNFTFTKNVGELLEATASTGAVTLDETYPGGQVEHFELGILSGTLYAPNANRLAILMKVKESDDPQCPAAFFTEPTIATLTLLPGAGVTDTAIFIGVPKSQSPAQFKPFTTTPCKGNHIHGWENGSGGVTVRVRLTATSGA
jgi:hypothetical protein